MANFLLSGSAEFGRRLRVIKQIQQLLRTLFDIVHEIAFMVGWKLHWDPSGGSRNHGPPLPQSLRHN